MVSRNATVATRISIKQGDLIEAIVDMDKLKESELFRDALSEYISNHHPDMIDAWNEAR